MQYIGILLRHAFKSVNLPPRERELPFHPSNLLLIFSTRGIQFATLKREPETGTPKYFIGHFPIKQLNISEKMEDFSGSWSTIITSLLSKLIFKPDIPSCK